MADTSSKTDKVTEDLDQSFNDSELSDIMNEIESLEKEFVDDIDVDSDPDSLKINESKDNNLQNSVDADIESVLKSASGPAVVEAVVISEPVVTPVEEVKSIAEPKTPVIESANTSNVVSLQDFKKASEEPATVPASLPVGQEMNFTLNGQFSLKFNFTIGEETMSFTIAPDTGLMLEMNGGLKISLPLSTIKATALRKAS